MDLPGDGAVLRALLQRRAGDSRDDGHHIALVISGGGMRGAYAGGMADALHDAGLGRWMDSFYGTSAGAYVAAALMLGDGRFAGLVFHEDMACRAFIDPRRFGTRRPVVSIDHLHDEILEHAKPMAWERLPGSPLRVVATDADDLTPHALAPDTAEGWKRAMHASAAIPLFAGPPVELNGRRFIDGSVSEPLPVQRALRDGATHVLALLTRTVPELRRAAPGTGPARWARALDRLTPGLGAIAQEGPRISPVLTLLDDAGHPERDGRHLYAVAPAVDTGVRGLTTDVDRVRHAAALGYATMAAHIAHAVRNGQAMGINMRAASGTLSASRTCC